VSFTELARRFLHVNLNTTDANEAQRFFIDCLALRLQMRTDPEIATDGAILGLSGQVRCDTRLLYDSRGARRSCAVEVIEWIDPVTAPSGRLTAESVGLMALGFRVSDLAGCLTAVEREGFAIHSHHGYGFITGGRAATVIGPDGVIVEIGENDSAAKEQVIFAGVRIACTDLEESLKFYASIGFRQTHAVERRTHPARDLGIATRGDQDLHLCYLELPEDRATTRICLTQHCSAEVAPTQMAPNQQGLFRCALRVENTRAAIESTANTIAVRGPIWCPLPGTPIPGLTIAFMTAPEGVVIEYVERPLALFRSG